MKQRTRNVLLSTLLLVAITAVVVTALPKKVNGSYDYATCRRWQRQIRAEMWTKHFADAFDGVVPQGTRLEAFAGGDRCAVMVLMAGRYLDRKTIETLVYGENSDETHTKINQAALARWAAESGFDDGIVVLGSRGEILFVDGAIGEQHRVGEHLHIPLCAEPNAIPPKWRMRLESRGCNDCPDPNNPWPTADSPCNDPEWPTLKKREPKRTGWKSLERLFEGGQP